MIDLIIDIINFILEALRILDCNLRYEVYFAITGIFIAIAIFIGEVMNPNKENILENKIILKNTKIVEEIYWILITFFMLWFNSLLSDIKELSICKLTIICLKHPVLCILYYIIQIIINILIIITAIKTFNIFKITLEIKKDKQYLDKLVCNYTIDRIGELTKQKEELNKTYIKKKDILMTKLPKLTIAYGDENLKSNYKKIYASKDGTITDIDVNSILKNISLEKIQNIDSKEYLKPPIYLTKEIGETIYKGDCIAQYKLMSNQNKNNALEKVIKAAINITNEKIIVEEELYLCFNYQIDLMSKKESNSIIEFYNQFKNYDEVFFQFIKFLNEVIEKTDMNEVFILNLQNLLNNIVKNEENKEHFYHCINVLGKIAIKRIKKCKNNDEVNDYIFNEFINIINPIYHISEVNNKNVYFEIVNYLLLKVITYLIDNKKLKAVDIIVENIGYLKYSKKNENAKIADIKRHFSIALTYIFITYFNEKDNHIQEIKNAKSLINNIYKNLNAKKLFSTDAILSINDFENIYNSDTKISNTYKHLSLDLINHKYKRTWGGNYYEYKEETLITILTLFNSRYVLKEKNKLPKLNRYSCDNILDMLDNPKRLKFLEFLNKKPKLKIRFEKLILDIKNEDIKRETEYLISTPLSKSFIQTFKQVILKEMKNNSPILKKIEQIKKVEHSNKRLKEVLGYNTKILRDSFFEKNEGNINSFAKELADSMKNSIEEDILNKLPIENMKKVSDIFDIIKGIKNQNEYTLLINYEDYIKYFENIKDDYMVVNNKKVKIIETITDYSVLIHNDDWPVLKYCTFAKNIANNQQCIKDNSYYVEIIDLAAKENEKLVEQAVVKNKNVYDANYFKTHCILKFLVSYRIECCECNKSYIIVKNNN